MICQICQQDFSDFKTLHKHLRKEKITVEDYYKKFFPRKDLFTGQLISFKDHESYLSSNFETRANLSAWFRANWKTDEAKQMAVSIISERVKSKKLEFAPSQVELRTIKAPSITGIEKMFGSYHWFCGDAKLKPRFNYALELSPVESNMEILIDTREQAPLEFGISKKTKLDTGDYTAGKGHYCDIYIERKSIEDFFSTFFNTKNYERFRREAQRAKEVGFYLFVLVEESLDKCLSFTSPHSNFKELAPHTFKHVRDLMTEYDMQFAFCRNRAHMKDVILKILSQGDNAKLFDFQYLIDSGKI